MANVAEKLFVLTGIICSGGLDYIHCSVGYGFEFGSTFSQLKFRRCLK